MEQLSIKKFTTPIPPDAPRVFTPQPMKHVPLAKRPVGRPRKRPCDNPDTTQCDAPDTTEAPVQERSTPKPKRVRAAYSLKKKEVVEYAKQYSMYQACKHCKLSAGAVWLWMKLDFSKESCVVYRSTGADRKLSYPTEKENELVQWVLEQRDVHLAVSVEHIIDQAVLTIQPVCPKFKGNRDWAQKFMRWNNLTIRAKTTITQKLPSALEEKMSSFLNSVREVQKEHDYPLDMIINMDETPMWFDMTTGKLSTANQPTLCPSGPLVLKSED